MYGCTGTAHPRIGSISTDTTNLQRILRNGPVCSAERDEHMIHYIARSRSRMLNAPIMRHAGSLQLGLVLLLVIITTPTGVFGRIEGDVCSIAGFAPFTITTPEK